MLTGAEMNSGASAHMPEPAAGDGLGHASAPSVEWPTMDEAAYHGLAGEIVKTIEPHSEADPVALLVQVLIMAGNLAGRGPYYQVESDRHYPNLFGVLVGDSGKGRKGTSLSRIKAIAEIADEAWAANRMKGGLSSGEGLIYAVRDPVQEFDAKEGKIVTIDPGANDKRLMVVESEYASALSVAERPGNTLSPLIRLAWDGNKLTTMTKNSALCATDPHISIIGHITTDELRARISRTDLANGFGNRFIYILARRSKKLPFGGDLKDSEIHQLGERLKEVISVAKSIGRVRMTDEAADKWVQLYDTLSEGQGGLLGAVIGRSEAQVIRLALVYALLDSRDAIDTPHLQAAAAVWDYAEASAAYVFGAMVGDPLADAILQALRGAPQGMTRSEINDHLGHHRKSDRIRAALALLKGKGFARFFMKETGGRAAEIWMAMR